MSKKHPQSPLEELINFFTHIPGVLFGLFGMAILIYKTGFTVQNIPEISSYVIYGLSFTAVFGASVLYHKTHPGELKQFYKKLDHACIYIFMAGCYTPFVVNFMLPDYRYLFLGIVWLVAGLGVLFKFRHRHGHSNYTVALYFAFGFMCFLAKSHFIDMIPEKAFTMLLVGGAFYSVGVIFYLLERMPFNHGLWHIFVLLGAGSHYYAIYSPY